MSDARCLFVLEFVRYKDKCSCLQASFLLHYLMTMHKYYIKKWHTKLIYKGIYLSKALTCMKIFLNKQELLFCQGDGYLWPHCCMNNLYISQRSLYVPTYSFWAIGSMLISLFRVTSWFDTVNNAVTRWMNFVENHLHEHNLQLFDYNI